MPDADRSYGFPIVVLLVQKPLVDSLYRQSPAGVGSTSAIILDDAEMDAMLTGTLG
jgi:tRNA-splicing ligase RtcB